MNKCPVCDSLLAFNNTCVAYKGHLFCSSHCCKQHIATEHASTMGYVDRHDITCAIYNAYAEEVDTEDVLAEDFNTDIISVECIKYVKVPKSLTPCQSLEYLRSLYAQHLVDIDLDNADDIKVHYKRHGGDE